MPHKRREAGDILVAYIEAVGPVQGPWYRMLALGAGDTEVSGAPYVPRSRSREITFQHDLTDRSEIGEHVAALARRVAQDVAAEGRPAHRVATSDPAEIERAALAALERFEHDRPVRLLGVRAEFREP